MCEISRHLIVCSGHSMTARQSPEWVRARQAMRGHSPFCAALAYNSVGRVVSIEESTCDCRAGIAPSAAPSQEPEK
jgi:hypothetical protein